MPRVGINNELPRTDFIVVRAVRIMTSVRHGFAEAKAGGFPK